MAYFALTVQCLLGIIKPIRLRLFSQCQRVLEQSGLEVLDKPVTPEEKAAYVRDMFDDIAPRYDLLNSVLSAGIHKGWRGFATRCACLELGNSVLDVCSGTGEWTPSLRRAVGPDGLSHGGGFLAADASVRRY